RTRFVELIEQRDNLKKGREESVSRVLFLDITEVAIEVAHSAANRWTGVYQTQNFQI
ncbi:hypothetical protein GW17_00025601, partial [Ensete ventricosum]